jgi:hypothetical protein
MKRALIAVLITAVFVAASLIALSMIGEVALNSQSMQSDIRTR